MPKAIPQGLHSVTPQLTVDGCAEAIETWKKAFGAEELMRAPDPSGKMALLACDKYPKFVGVKVISRWGDHNPRVGIFNFEATLTLLANLAQHGKRLWAELQYKSYDDRPAVLCPIEFQNDVFEHNPGNYSAPVHLAPCLASWLNYINVLRRHVAWNPAWECCETSESAQGKNMANDKTFMVLQHQALKSIYSGISSVRGAMANINFYYKPAQCAELALEAAEIGVPLSATDAKDTDGTRAQSPVAAEASYSAFKTHLTAQAIYDWCVAKGTVERLAWPVELNAQYHIGEFVTSLPT